MKRILALVTLAATSAMLVNCAEPAPPVHVHHYHSTPRPSKPKPPSDRPEDFQAITPPSSYSR
jgi:hypothetical protein